MKRWITMFLLFLFFQTDAFAYRIVRSTDKDAKCTETIILDGDEKSNFDEASQTLTISNAKKKKHTYECSGSCSSGSCKAFYSEVGLGIDCECSSGTGTDHCGWAIKMNDKEKL